MNKFIKCNKCLGECQVDGEYPKFFAWCETCNTYAAGFDIFDYAAEYLSSKIDEVYDRMKDEQLHD